MIDVDMVQVWRLQLEVDLPHYLNKRNWHEFSTMFPKETCIAIYDVLQMEGLKATVMIGPPGGEDDKSLVFIAAMSPDELEDLEAARPWWRRGGP